MNAGKLMTNIYHPTLRRLAYNEVSIIVINSVNHYVWLVMEAAGMQSSPTK